MVVNNIKKQDNRSVQVITEEEMLDKFTDTKDNQMFVGIIKEEKMMKAKSKRNMDEKTMEEKMMDALFSAKLEEVSKKDMEEVSKEEVSKMEDMEFRKWLADRFLEKT